MPFVIPASTRGQRRQPPFSEVCITRIADLIAGAGLEKYRVEFDLKQEAEEMLPSARAIPTGTANQNQQPVSSSAAADQATAGEDTATLVDVPASQSDERVLINKFGAHFVYVPTLGRFVARADRKTVRASTITGRVCFALQVLVVVVGLYISTVRSVDCAPVSLSSRQHDAAAPTTSSASPSSVSARGGSGADATAPSSITVHYPGWDYLSTKGFLFQLAFFVFLIGGCVLQSFLLISGDNSAGNPGFLSLDGDEVTFQISLSQQQQQPSRDESLSNNNNNNKMLVLPHELRRSCKTCGIPQPLRTRHCRSCGRCVPRSDHHCFFLGHCVGSFDYGGFVLLIGNMAVAATLGVDVLFGSWLDVSHPVQGCGVPGSPDAGWVHRTLHANGLLLVEIVATLIAVVLLWILFISHILFTFTETTTYEFARPGKNTHMRYYACPSERTNANISSSSSSGGAISRLFFGNSGSSSSSSNYSLSSSPFSNPSVITNFTALWWYFGFKSIRRRFKNILPVACLKAGRDESSNNNNNNSALVLRCGSPDGINYFVSVDQSSGRRDEINV